MYSARRVRPSGAVGAFPLPDRYRLPIEPWLCRAPCALAAARRLGGAEREFALHTKLSIAKAPKQRARGLHEQVKTVSVANFKWAVAGFQRPNLHNRKHGAMPTGLLVAPF